MRFRGFDLLYTRAYQIAMTHKYSYGVSVSQKLQQDAINTCSVTLNLSIYIRDAQQQDASIAKLRDLKLRNQPFAGHMGVARTEERIRQRSYRLGIHNSVQTFIHNCRACAQRKIATHNNKAPTHHIEAGEPFTFWAKDYMGPLPETARGNRNILVMMDHFSKWCEAFPTEDQKTSTVPNILLHKVFSTL